MAVDAHGMQVRIIVTSVTRNDCTQANELISGISADHLVGDKAYDTNRIVEQAKLSGAKAVIASKRNRKKQRVIDGYLYSLRHIVENTFQQFKEWRGIATRYCKNSLSFMAALQIRAVVMWGKSLDDTP